MKTPARCLSCGRVLTNPVSIRRGYGPGCAKKVVPAAPPAPSDYGAVSRTVDPALAGRSIAAVRRVIRRKIAAGQYTCVCGRPLTQNAIQAGTGYSDHPRGYHLPGFARPQWLWVRCTHCGREISIWKIGVSQALIDQELDQEHDRTPDPATGGGPNKTLTDYVEGSGNV